MVLFLMGKKVVMGARLCGKGRNMRQAVILAGGRGTRLGDLVQHTPKPLLAVGGQPFLFYLIWNLRRHGIKQIVLSVGYLAERIAQAFAGQKDVVISREVEPLGTGGGLRQANELLDDTFFVLNGDTLFDCNYATLELALRRGARAAIGLRQVGDTARYGAVRLEQGMVRGFAEKARSGPGLISGGVYALRREALALLPPGISSLESDLFPVLAEQGGLAGQAYTGFFLDIGLPETYREADVLLPLWRSKPALVIAPGAELPPETVRRANDAGWLVLALGGLGRVARRNLAAAGAHVDGVLGRSLPAGAGTKVAEVLAGFLHRWGADPTRSVLLATDVEDLEAGTRVGLRSLDVAIGVEAALRAAGLGTREQLRAILQERISHFPLPVNRVGPIFRHRDTRGEIAVLVDGEEFTHLKTLYIRQGEVSGRHYHLRKTEQTYILRGRARIQACCLDTGARLEFVVNAGDRVITRPYCAHRWTMLEDTWVVEYYRGVYERDDAYPYDCFDSPSGES
jgi:D-glycero-D-manno-heptose 1,7-bisphosphate phosphatase